MQHWFQIHSLLTYIDSMYKTLTNLFFVENH